MSQATILKELIDKRRRKYWEYKDANDWRKYLLLYELECLNKRIEYLRQICIQA